MAFRRYTRVLTPAFLALLGGAAGLPSTALAEAECTDPACFLDAVSRCEPARFTVGQPDEIGARGRYRVLGPTQYACRLEFGFIENPNPDLVGKTFTFVIDPASTATAEALREVVATCLMGGEAWYQCEGPLIETATGRAEPPRRLPAGSGRFPCGTPVAVDAPALYPLPADGKWGYVDRTGEWQIPPQWDQVHDFHEGRAAVGSPGGWGIIDTEGHEIVPPRFQGSSFVTIGDRNWYSSPFSPYSEGCTVVTHFERETRPSFFLDREGFAWWRAGAQPAALQDRDIRRFGRFSEGLAWFQQGFGEEARYGWVNRDGDIAIDAEFVQASRFAEGLAFAAVRDGQGAYISPEGTPVLPRKWTLYSAGPFSEGLARVSPEAFDLAFWTANDIAFDTVRFAEPSDARPEEAGIGEAGDFRDGLAPIITGFRDGNDLVYAGSDGTVAFVPDELPGIRVCNRRALPEFHQGLVRLVVADDGENCGNEGYTRGLAHYHQAHYVYLDTAGRVVLRQEK